MRRCANEKNTDRYFRNTAVGLNLITYAPGADMSSDNPKFIQQNRLVTYTTKVEQMSFG